MDPGNVENKALVRKWLSCFASNSYEAAIAMLSEDCDFWILGASGGIATAGSRSRAEAFAALERLKAAFPEGLPMHILSLTAEGDRVVAETVGHAITQYGNIYDNNYSFHFVVRDGKFCSVREYYDTMLAKIIFSLDCD